MSEFHGPKCQEMCFPAFQFSKPFQTPWRRWAKAYRMGDDGLKPIDRDDGLKAIVWVLRTHIVYLSTFHKTPAT